MPPVADPTSANLARNPALKLKAKPIPVESKTIRNGESYPRFDRDLRGEEVIIVPVSAERLRKVL